MNFSKASLDAAGMVKHAAAADEIKFGVPKRQLERGGLLESHIRIADALGAHGGVLQARLADVHAHNGLRAHARHREGIPPAAAADIQAALAREKVGRLVVG